MPHRILTAQDTETPTVLVTYTALDGQRTTERVSQYLADLLSEKGII